jgi:hypothetical protein
MLRFTERWPLWALAPVLFVVLTGVFFGLQYVLPGQGHRSVVGLFIGSLFYGAVMTLFFSFRIAAVRRRMRGAENAGQIRRAIRSGTLPSDADPTIWLPELERTRGQYRRARWSGPVLFGVMIALTIWLAITVSPVWLVMCAAFIALIAWLSIETVRGLHHIEGMIAELERRTRTWPGLPG